MQRDRQLNEVELARNASTLYYIKSTIACFAGAYAGLLGLTNWSGFSFFFLTSLCTSSLVYTFKCDNKPASYFAKAADVWTASVLGNLLPFVLFWTLAFALVHIYD